MRFYLGLECTVVVQWRGPEKKGLKMNYGYLIDMDGVMYRDNQLIDGAQRFIKSLQEDDVPFMFLTNNSQRTLKEYLVENYPATIEKNLNEWTAVKGVRAAYKMRRSARYKILLVLGRRLLGGKTSASPASAGPTS